MVEEEEPIDYDEGIGSMSMMDGMEDDDDDVALVEVRGCSGLFCVSSLGFSCGRRCVCFTNVPCVVCWDPTRLPPECLCLYAPPTLFAEPHL